MNDYYGISAKVIYSDFVTDKIKFLYGAFS